jgi:hypothetical protein
MGRLNSLARFSSTVRVDASRRCRPSLPRAPRVELSG